MSVTEFDGHRIIIWFLPRLLSIITIHPILHSLTLMAADIMKLIKRCSAPLRISNSVHKRETHRITPKFRPPHLQRAFQDDILHSTLRWLSPRRYHPLILHHRVVIISTTTTINFQLWRSPSSPQQQKSEGDTLNPPLSPKLSSSSSFYGWCLTFLDNDDTSMTWRTWSLRLHSAEEALVVLMKLLAVATILSLVCHPTGPTVALILLR